MYKYLLLFIGLFGFSKNPLSDKKNIPNPYISFSFRVNLDSFTYKLFFLEKSDLPDYISRSGYDDTTLPNEFDEKLFTCLEKTILDQLHANKSRLPLEEYHPFLEKYLDSSAKSYTKPLKRNVERGLASVYVFDIDNDGFQDILLNDIDISSKYKYYQVYLYHPSAKKYTLERNFFQNSFFLGYDSSYKYIYTWHFNGSRYNTTIDKNEIQNKQLKKVESVFYKNDLQIGKSVMP